MNIKRSRIPASPLQERRFDQVEPPSIDINEDSLPIKNQSIFWCPRHTENAHNLLHTPFLFWVIDTLRPKRIIQIGLEDSSAYLNICYAVEKSRIETVVMGIDDTSDISELISVHDSLYGEFSFVRTTSLLDTRKNMITSEVDLIIINKAITPEVTDEFIMNWLELLSDQGAIVLCEPENTFTSPEARSTFEEVMSNRPVISFPEAKPGLDVILYGNQPNDRLLKFSNLKGGTSDYLAARRVFSRLGQGLIHEINSINRLAKLTEAVADRDALANQLELERSAKSEFEDREIRQNLQISNLQSEVFSLRKSIRSATTPSDVSIKDNNALIPTNNSKNSNINDNAEKLAQALEVLKSENHRLLREARDNHVALSRASIEASEQKKIDQKHISKLKECIKSSDRKIDTLNREVISLRNSTSWKITYPLRWVKITIRRLLRFRT